MNNKLSELFGVKNHLELMNYIKNNPDDERVKEVKELLEMFDMVLCQCLVQVKMRKLSSD